MVITFLFKPCSTIIMLVLLLLDTQKNLLQTNMCPIYAKSAPIRNRKELITAQSANNVSWIWARILKCSLCIHSGWDQWATHEILTKSVAHWHHFSRILASIWLKSVFHWSHCCSLVTVANRSHPLYYYTLGPKLGRPILPKVFLQKN